VHLHKCGFNIMATLTQRVTRRACMTEEIAGATAQHMVVVSWQSSQHQLPAVQAERTLHVSGLPELLNLTQKLLPSYETYVIPWWNVVCWCGCCSCWLAPDGLCVADCTLLALWLLGALQQQQT